MATRQPSRSALSAGGRVTDLLAEIARRFSIPAVAAIAEGPQKVEGIRGALKTRCVDVLITNEATASALLAN
jgi:DNA-binding transcriptional regulator LsrR (DeoR family)